MTLPLLLGHPLPPPSPPTPHTAPPLQDFVLLKERTLDEAPRPPKKAMDYSSSSEEVESSEDDEEESNGEPSEGSRDTPGARYGAPWEGGTPVSEAPKEKGCRFEGGGPRAHLWGTWCHCGECFLPFSGERGVRLVFLSLPRCAVSRVVVSSGVSATSLPQPKCRIQDTQQWDKVAQWGLSASCFE